jgi:quinol monooxygenase YgiN
MKRREFVGTAALALLAGTAAPALAKGTAMEEAYGIIGQMKTAPGKRSEVIAALLEGTRDMPGNIAYLIAEDLEDENSIWITEVWQTKTDHANSLQLPQVQAAIGKARAHITGFGTRVETRPVGLA